MATVDDERDERKERVLHTRVPESLDRHLKHRARRLGMSVSTVVRHVLLNTFGLVEDIVNDSADVAAALTGAAPEPRETPRARDGRLTVTADRGEVLAWQEVVLNLNAVCERCNAVLRKGARAALGLREHGPSRAVLCLRCLERTQREPTLLPAGRARR
jgi:hypothetical protein